MLQDTFRRNKEKQDQKLQIRISSGLMKQIRSFKLNASAIARERLEQVVQYLEKQHGDKS